MAADVLGYYSALGLGPGASIDDVRAAYRRLAKEYHPDTSGYRDGGERFRRITEAYDALSDDAFKASYDAQAVEPASGSAEPSPTIDPVTCDVCGKTTAQPRRLSFWRVTSFLLATRRTPIQKVFCQGCAAKEQWKSTIWTGLLVDRI